MNTNILYKLIIFLGIFWLSSCSDDDSESKLEYEVVDNVVTSWDALSEHCENTIPFTEMLCIGESDECPLSNTYISIVNYGSEYTVVIPRGTLSENEYGFLIYKSVPSNNYMKEVLNADYYANVIVMYGGEGIYDFAVRIYNPTLNKYYITRPYQLKVWREGIEGDYKWYRTISLVNK